MLIPCYCVTCSNSTDILVTVDILTVTMTRKSRMLVDNITVALHTD